MGLVERIRVFGPNREVKKKYKVLSDITNKLEARPTTFKPGWAGFRQERDKLFKEILVELSSNHVGPPAGDGPNKEFSFHRAILLLTDRRSGSGSITRDP